MSKSDMGFVPHSGYGIFHRQLLWKEWRELAPVLWGYCITLTVTVTLWSLNSAVDFGQLMVREQLMAVGFVFIHTCAILIGACLFVPEKENRTAGFLSTLPIPGYRIALNKLFVGGTLVTVQAIICLTIIQFTIGVQSGVGGVLKFFEVSPVVEFLDQMLLMVECFFYGVLWSLLTRKTLFALMYAAISVYLVNALAGTGAGVGFFVEFPRALVGSAIAQSLANSWIIRLPLLGAVIVTIFGKTYSWLNDQTGHRFVNRRFFGRRSSSGNAATTQMDADSTLTPKVSVEHVHSRLTVLVWQAIRQSRAIWILSFIGCLIMFGILWLARDGALFLLPSVVLLASALIGSMTFWPDQDNSQFRFFQQHGENARLVWLSRIVIPAVIVLLIVIAAGAALQPLRLFAGYQLGGAPSAEAQLSVPEYFVDSSGFGRLILAGLLGLATGQFFSLFVKSGLVSMVCAIATAGIVLVWHFVVSACGASPFVFILPVVFVLFGSTWWFAPRWLIEKQNLFDKVFPWGVVTVLAFVMLIGFSLYRSVDVISANQNWYRAMGLNETRIASSLKETKAITDSIRTPDRPVQLSVTRNQKWAASDWHLKIPVAGDEYVDRFVELNESALQVLNGIDFPDLSALMRSNDPKTSRARYIKLLTLSRCGFDYAIRRDDLEAAWNYWLASYHLESLENVRSNETMGLLFRWSQHENQSVSLLKKALNELTPENRLRLERTSLFRLQKEAEDRFQALHRGDMSYANQELPEVVRQMFRFMPWEIDRALEIHRHFSDLNFAKLGAWAHSYYADPTYANGIQSFKPEIPNWLASKARTSPVFPHAIYWASDLPVSNLHALRYLRIRLALDAYRLKHSEYPEQLHKLVPEFLEEVPCDAFTGGDFAYSAKGLDHPVVFVSQDYVFSRRNINKRHLIYDNSTIWSGPFLLPWSSTGGQSLTEFSYIKDDGSSKSSAKASKTLAVKCYNLLGNGLFPTSYPKELLQLAAPSDRSDKVALENTKSGSSKAE